MSDFFLFQDNLLNEDPKEQKDINETNKKLDITKQPETIVADIPTSIIKRENNNSSLSYNPENEFKTSSIQDSDTDSKTNDEPLVIDLCSDSDVEDSHNETKNNDIIDLTNLNEEHSETDSYSVSKENSSSISNPNYINNTCIQENNKQSIELNNVSMNGENTVIDNNNNNNNNNNIKNRMDNNDNTIKSVIDYKNSNSNSNSNTISEHIYTPTIDDNYELTPREEDKVEREILVHDTINNDINKNNINSIDIENDILNPSSNYDPLDISMCEDYFSRSTSQMVCYICRKPGHKASECLEALSSRCCFLCGKRGHESRKCPFRICNRCHQSGHNAEDCTNKVLYTSCFICGSKLHTVKNCPLEINSAATEPLYSNQIHCIYCYKSGHCNCSKLMKISIDQSIGQCPKCGLKNHTLEECHSYRNNNMTTTQKCFFCGETGHIKMNCPFAKQQSVYDNHHNNNNNNNYNNKSKYTNTNRTNSNLKYSHSTNNNNNYNNNNNNNNNNNRSRVITPKKHSTFPHGNNAFPPNNHPRTRAIMKNKYRK